MLILFFRDVTLSAGFVVPDVSNEHSAPATSGTAKAAAERHVPILGNTAVIRTKPATSFAIPTVKEISTHIRSFSIQHFRIRFLTTSISSCLSDDGQSNRNTFNIL